jgi:lysophospholipase L1-like esterase
MSEFRKKRMLQRIHDVNRDLSRTAHEYGMTFLDQDSVPGVSDPSLWSADGLHLNSAGHAYVAEVMAHITRSLLGERAI